MQLFNSFFLADICIGKKKDRVNRGVKVRYVCYNAVMIIVASQETGNIIC